MVINFIDVELFDLKLSDLIFWPVKKKFAVDIKLPKESSFVGFFFFISKYFFFNSGTRVQMY